MTYTVVINKNSETLVFKGIGDFVIEPRRAKVRIDDWKEHSSEWHTIEDVEGLTLYKDDAETLFGKFMVSLMPEDAEFIVGESLEWVCSCSWLNKSSVLFCSKCEAARY